MIRLLVIADDFTGALDTGIQFVKKGIETQVVTGTCLDSAAVSQTAQVLVIDPETRLMSAEEAYEAVKKIAHQAAEMGIETIYKKTDSALRGNVGSELSAVLDGTNGKRLFFIPAFPDAQRVTEKGIHYIDGEKLEKSSFSIDPFNPMTCSYVPQILSQQTEKRIVLVERNEDIPDATEKAEIVVFDALENHDIQKRTETLERRNDLHLLAGCAGFASFLADALNLQGNGRGEIDRTSLFCVACGSLNPITEKQIAYAQKHGFVRKTLLPEQKLHPEYYETEDGKAFLDELECLFREYSYVEIDTFDAVEGSTEECARREGIPADRIRFAVAESLGKVVSQLIRRKLDMTVLMTGGDTLMGVMNEMGVNKIQLIAEVGQGTVLSKFCWDGRDVQVISKSGGFGEKEVLVRLAEELTMRYAGREDDA